MAVLDSILDFLNSAKILSQEENIYYCKNRDAANSRNQKWINLFLQNKLDINNAAILTAIIGEITNNSFDHNLGMWNGPVAVWSAFKSHLKI